MKVETEYFDRVEQRKLRRKKTIVIHWPAGSISTISGLWKWMNAMSTNSYHAFISRNQVLKTRDQDLRAIHCGHKTYTDFAKSYFGNHVCSDYDSPNNYTIGICILHDKPDGSYFQDTIDTAVEYLAGICFQYGLNPLEDIIRHSDITDEKSTFCPKYFKDDAVFLTFKKKIDVYMNEYFINARDKE